MIEAADVILSHTYSTVHRRMQYENKKSPDNAMGNAQQQCMFESPVKQDLSQSPESDRRPAAKLSLVFYSYSPEEATCLAQPTPYRLKIANFSYLPLI